MGGRGERGGRKREVGELSTRCLSRTTAASTKNSQSVHGISPPSYPPIFRSHTDARERVAAIFAVVAREQIRDFEGKKGLRVQRRQDGLLPLRARARRPRAARRGDGRGRRGRARRAPPPRAHVHVARPRARQREPLPAAARRPQRPLGLRRGRALPLPRALRSAPTPHPPPPSHVHPHPHPLSPRSFLSPSRRRRCSTPTSAARATSCRRTSSP